MKLKEFSNFVAGESKRGSASEIIDVFAPAENQLYGKLHDSTTEDLDAAVKMAKEAQREWMSFSRDEKSNVLTRIAKVIEDHFDLFLETEVKDTGKLLSFAKNVDIPRSVTNFRFFSQHISSFDGKELRQKNAQGREEIFRVLSSPLGIVGVISPWNLPLYLLTWKIAPALAAGNAVIAKPSELTPASASLLGELLATYQQKINLPTGLISILHGYGKTIGEAIVEHPEIKAISFTGGTFSGRKVYEKAASGLKKCSLELGGKNPFVVFDDANLEEAVDLAVRSSFSNQGQICLCSSRFYLQENIYEKFKQSFIEKTKKIELGSLISSQHKEKVMSFLLQAKECKGVFLTGDLEEQKKHEGTNFLDPVILENLPQKSPLNQEEIFGPVVTLNSFKGEEEAIMLANDSSYGLAASIWTTNLGRMLRLSQQVEAGNIWFNGWMRRDLRAPFGGMKNSGVGREGSVDSIRFFTQEKSIFMGEI